MPPPIIEVDNLVKKYGEATAVDNISFTVSEGLFFGFLGPNGAGKTTTMRILATLLKKTSGSVTVAGFDVDRRPDDVRRAIGFAMQDISLDNLASGYENLQLLGVLYGLTPAQSRARAGELLETVGLSKVAERWVNSYSGGMRRRLDLAGVLMHSPRILFLDEPTQGLDPQARRTIWDHLRALNKEGSTIFLTTHYMDEADILCDTLAFIDQGKIVCHGTPQGLKDEMGGNIVTLRFQPTVSLDAVRSVLQSTFGSDAVITTKDQDVQVTSHHAEETLPRMIQDLNATGLAPLSLSVS
ncbi:MAG: ATP-binding cassette domain-containing protein, partial [Armatimonadota bacterium]|nr:ATP-binding cassette domain-containing protein [Armatimonadota bacterium]